MRAAGVVLALLLAAPLPAAPQLASPGRLSRAHADLEGIRNCTRCHELRQPGISAARCLECHAPVQARIRAGGGYHGRLEERDCARCHQEHIGVAADIVRLDTAVFRHEATGWPLRGAHAGAGCRECHRPPLVTAPDVRAYAPSPAYLARTWLGVATTCNGCHGRESPHESAIDRKSCGECHTEQSWTELRTFDHARTAYPLSGAHRDVTCAGCHRRGDELRLLGVRHAECSDCHRDPHAGRLGSGCSGCHRTDGWGRVPAERVADRFDHARTAFPLRGAHARAACAACHDRARARRSGLRITFRQGTEHATFPRPVASACGSCHVDAHQGQLRGAAAACERCHGEAGWLPVRFDIARHQRETRFPLEGAHLAVPCGRCHTPQPGGGARLRFPDLDCAACHREQDPHGSMFAGRTCASCHRGGAFRGIRFDHVGADARSCATCHDKDDPHGAQFRGRGCGECHVTTTFRIAGFDHARTRLPLTGAHASVPCAACHPRAADGVIRYRPIATDCASCHGRQP